MVSKSLTTPLQVTTMWRLTHSVTHSITAYPSDAQRKTDIPPEQVDIGHEGVWLVSKRRTPQDVVQAGFQQEQAEMNLSECFYRLIARIRQFRTVHGLLKARQSGWPRQEPVHSDALIPSIIAPDGVFGRDRLGEERLHLLNCFPQGQDHDMIAFLDPGIASRNNDLIRPNDHTHHGAAREADVQ